MLAFFASKSFSAITIWFFKWPSLFLSALISSSYFNNISISFSTFIFLLTSNRLNLYSNSDILHYWIWFLFSRIYFCFIFFWFSSFSFSMSFSFYWAAFWVIPSSFYMTFCLSSCIFIDSHKSWFEESCLFMKSTLSSSLAFMVWYRKSQNERCFTSLSWSMIITL